MISGDSSSANAASNSASFISGRLSAMASDTSWTWSMLSRIASMIESTMDVLTADVISLIDCSVLSFQMEREWVEKICNGPDNVSRGHIPASILLDRRDSLIACARNSPRRPVEPTESLGSQSEHRSGSHHPEEPGFGGFFDTHVSSPFSCASSRRCSSSIGSQCPLVDGWRLLWFCCFSATTTTCCPVLSMRWRSIYCQA